MSSTDSNTDASTSRFPHSVRRFLATTPFRPGDRSAFVEAHEHLWADGTTTLSEFDLLDIYNTWRDQREQPRPLPFGFAPGTRRDDVPAPAAPAPQGLGYVGVGGPVGPVGGVAPEAGQGEVGQGVNDTDMDDIVYYRDAEQRIAELRRLLRFADQEEEDGGRDGDAENDDDEGNGDNDDDDDDGEDEEPRLPWGTNGCFPAIQFR
jgi:hypothetical protein